jgi:hypothetical protein
MNALLILNGNTGSLSTQAIFALRLLGRDNVRGVTGWNRGMEGERRIRGQSTCHCPCRAPPTLLAVTATLEPIDETFPDVPDPAPAPVGL